MKYLLMSEGAKVEEVAMVTLEKLLAAMRTYRQRTTHGRRRDCGGVGCRQVR